MVQNKLPHVVVLGAGFGGLTFCRHFNRSAANVTLVDRTNHHLFQPLLYQVATAGLSAPEIAQPIRSILSDQRNVTVLLDSVTDLNLAQRQVILGSKTLAYDYLVLALGGRSHYFGHPEWENFAPGLKTLADALRIRSDVLLAFEKAENSADKFERTRLMTIVIIGGGPTGVELAGAFAGLARHVLKRDFRHIDPAQAKIILIEGGPRVLSSFPEDLSENTACQLERLGVQLRTATSVKEIRHREVYLDKGEIIHAENIIWAAGVSASPISGRLGVELDRIGRVKVNPDLSLPGQPEVFAIGDMAFLSQDDGKPVPGVSPAAMQMAQHVSQIIADELTGQPGRRSAFKYWDKGSMATIGRSKAVAVVGNIKLTGLIAWLAWLSLHLVFLIGFRNKIIVLIQWMYSYFAYKRGARIITEQPADSKSSQV